MADLDLNQYQAILFDFDGTLAPCLDLRSMKRSLLDFTITTTGIERSQIESMLVIEFIEFTADWLHKRGGDGQDYRGRAHGLVQSIEMRAARETTLYGGVLELLADLREREIGIGIVTRNCEAAVRQMFPEVDHYCPALYTRDHVPQEKLKPDPQHLLMCAKQLRCEVNKAVMVGDGILDMQVAASLGMPRIAVLGGHNGEGELAAAGANWILSNIREMRRYL